MKMPQRFGLYAILTDPLNGYDDTAKVLVDHQVACIQLRMKKEPHDVIARTAERIRKITADSSSLFFVNDHPDIAAKIGADGVHLGQTDMPFDTVRAMVGPDILIGLSTHNPEQSLNACTHSPAYIGIGPVYPTPTKINPDPVIGIDGMKKMLAVSTVPAVAIGGIDLMNLREVLNGGAQNFCMVRQLMNAEDPAMILKVIATIYKDYYRDTGN